MKHKHIQKCGVFKKPWQRTAAVFLTLVLSFALFVTPAAAQESKKTETVYAALNNDGSVNTIYVVNHLMGSYTDYGTYTDIKNLSTLSEPAVDGDMITFPDEPTEEGLYYQGTMTGELPMTFSFQYYLDGEPVSADSLAGTNGHLKIVMDYAPNQSCDENVREGIMAQVSAVFCTQTASNISAGDFTVVTVGSSVNLSYIITPDESGSLVMEADVNNFEMDPVTITMLKGVISLSGVSDSIDEFENGMSDMINGAGDLVEGTTELQDGMKTLAGKASTLNKALQSLSDAGSQIDDGMTQYEAALSAFISGVQGLKPASADIRAGLETLAANGSSVASGVSSVSSSLSALAGNSELQALAQSLAESPDESVRALANGTLQMIGGLQELSGGLASASSGLDAYAGGVSEAAQGYAAFDDGVSQLSDGSGQIVSGFSDIHSGYTSFQQGVSQGASGFYKLYRALKGLPSDIQELIDGQIEFKDGIASAKDDITEKTDSLTGSDEPDVSFASPEKNHPDSVQYILTTPGIEIKKVQKEEEEKDDGDFLSRLADLFR